MSAEESLLDPTTSTLPPFALQQHPRDLTFTQILVYRNTSIKIPWFSGSVVTTSVFSVSVPLRAKTNAMTFIPWREISFTQGAWRRNGIWTQTHFQYSIKPGHGFSHGHMKMTQVFARFSFFMFYVVVHVKRLHPRLRKEVIFEFPNTPGPA